MATRITHSTNRYTRNLWQLGLTIALGIAAALPASAQTYSFVDFDGAGDHAGGTTINGINNLGQEIGFSTNAGDATFTNFIRNTDGTFTTLTTLVNTEQANGINNAGTVVGANGTNAFTMTKNGTQSNLALVNANSTSQVAFGINDGGLIVGQYVNSVTVGATTTTTTPGFLRSTGGTFTSFTPTTTPATTITNVQGINNNGIAVGFDSPDGVTQHGFIWNTVAKTVTQVADPSTSRTQLDGLVLTQFLGINDFGTAVGYYQTNNGSQFGFTYNTAKGTYTFLDDPNAAPVGGVQITQITGIDNKGDLSGFAVNASGVQRGFIAVAVPETGTFALLLGPAGVLGLVIRRRRTTAA